MNCSGEENVEGKKGGGRERDWKGLSVAKHYYFLHACDDSVFKARQENGGSSDHEPGWPGQSAGNYDATSSRPRLRHKSDLVLAGKASE